MPINAGMMSSDRSDWETPRDLFDRVDAIWHFDLDEYARFLDFGVQLAKMYEWRSSHETCPPMVEAKAVVTKGTLDKKGAKLTVEVRGKTLAQVEPFIEEPVVIQLYPEQMPLPLDDGIGVIDMETGEVING